MQNIPFSNANVPLADLPDVEQFDWQALSPRYMPINAMLNLLVTLVLLIIWFVSEYTLLSAITADYQPLASWVMLGLIALSVLYNVYGIFADQRVAYALREHDVGFRWGLLFRHTVIQPLTRIQHIELKRGPLERSAGLATLQVFSAGSGTYTFAIPGLPIERAQGLRQFILRHQDLQHGG